MFIARKEKRISPAQLRGADDAAPYSLNMSAPLDCAGGLYWPKL